MTDAQTPGQLSGDLVRFWEIDATGRCKDVEPHVLLRDRIRNLLQDIESGKMGLLTDLP